ncbi:hypothetical protein D3879_10365 [Pseudomonas cavernicola]|uniref:Uncharacterized protein n=1 Tax=Pseudomonas cavernicola TaxID=2320866 RepID=A0A418XMA3_9PSED|nr:hypothetical protein [Pseudomonas cavernicola]RJG13609.1 hypothetical protein D3879_10365 [Pseudomonas cavernicola]
MTVDEGEVHSTPTNAPCLVLPGPRVKATKSQQSPVVAALDHSSFIQHHKVVSQAVDAFPKQQLLAIMLKGINYVREHN